MTDIQITRELLEAVSRGEVPERFLAQAGMQHLASLCPFCREEILAWEAKRADRPEYDYVLQALPSVLARHAPELEARWRRAEEDLAALLAVPREERRARIERARSRFRGPQIVELLIQESRRRIPGDPGEAYHLAELARFIVHRSPGLRSPSTSSRSRLPPWRTPPGPAAICVRRRSISGMRATSSPITG